MHFTVSSPSCPEIKAIQLCAFVGVGNRPKRDGQRESANPAPRKTEVRRFYEKQVDGCRTVGGTCAANVRTEEGKGASRKCRESDGGNPESSGQYTAERAG